MLLSLIIPCYNEQEAISIFYRETTAVLGHMDCRYELIFVDDGSKDLTIKMIKELAVHDTNVTYISFSRNFGKEAAMYAGFCNAQGDFVAVMDADMQDPPSLLPQMLNILRTDKYDCVVAYRKNRNGEPLIRSWFARKFYEIINMISDIDIVDGIRDYRLMKREMVEAVVSMNEINRFSKGIFSWIGFRTCWISYENVERIAGVTKWDFWKLFKYAVEGIIDFSQVPLKIASWFGIFMTCCSFIALLFIIVRKMLIGDPVAGWASTICVIIFIGGIQMFFLGIMGQYIAKIYIESKHRPHFIISETNRINVKKIE